MATEVGLPLVAEKDYLFTTEVNLHLVMAEDHPLAIIATPQAQPIFDNIQPMLVVFLVLSITTVNTDHCYIADTTTAKGCRPKNFNPAYTIEVIQIMEYLF